jgi:hypothetical protein
MHPTHRQCLYHKQDLASQAQPQSQDEPQGLSLALLSCLQQPKQEGNQYHMYGIHDAGIPFAKGAHLEGA